MVGYIVWMAKLADYVGLLAGWLAIMAVVLAILAG
jgi:hypothetical protein